MPQVKKLGFAVLALALSLLGGGAAIGQSPKPGVKGYEVEWVYRVRYGFIDEWWDLFRKYQIPILDGKSRSATFWTTGSIIRSFILTRRRAGTIASRSRIETWTAPGMRRKIADALFPDTATRKRAENRRWELTTNHWDLPIYQVDTTKPR